MLDASPIEKDREAEYRKRVRQLTRRGLFGLGAGYAAAYAGWRWLWSGPNEDGLSSRVREVLRANEKLSSNLLFSPRHLAPGFPKQAAKEPRVNGTEGLEDEFEPASWQLELTPLETTGNPPIHLTMDAIRRLPKVEHVTELKCIEGWSTVVHWAGARFSDFTRAHAPGSEAARYVGLQTPDGGYYVGLDMASALHPQTLLCYEMNGEPLTDDHGAPLRLVVPVKYGIKNLKRIGAIVYADEPPPDFWAEEGYDYYAGL